MSNESESVSVRQKQRASLKGGQERGKKKRLEREEGESEEEEDQEDQLDE